MKHPYTRKEIQAYADEQIQRHGLTGTHKRALLKKAQTVKLTDVGMRALESMAITLSGSESETHYQDPTQIGYGRARPGLRMGRGKGAEIPRGRTGSTRRSGRTKD
jgi:hypothetical protein